MENNIFYKTSDDGAITIGIPITPEESEEENKPSSPEEKPLETEQLKRLRLAKKLLKGTTFDLDHTELINSLFQSSLITPEDLHNFNNEVVYFWIPINVSWKKDWI